MEQAVRRFSAELALRLCDLCRGSTWPPRPPGVPPQKPGSFSAKEGTARSAEAPLYHLTARAQQRRTCTRRAVLSTDHYSFFTRTPSPDNSTHHRAQSAKRLRHRNADCARPASVQQYL